MAQLTGQKVGVAVGLMAAIPWFFGIFACYFIGKAATRVVRRRVWGTGLFISTGLCIFGSAWAGANHIPALGIIFITLAGARSFPSAPSRGPTRRRSSRNRGGRGDRPDQLARKPRRLRADPATSVNQITASDTGTMGVYALGVLPFLAAAMMFATRRFKNKADELLEQRKVSALTSALQRLDPAESTNHPAEPQQPDHPPHPGGA